MREWEGERGEGGRERGELVIRGKVIFSHAAMASPQPLSVS